tara:strand:- start:96 stop:281 length:186 start_codon:yes stop_codon:yes gene_type:complete
VKNVRIVTREEGSLTSTFEYNKIAYYEAALRGITKTDLVESETQPNTRLPDERLELQCGQL